MWTVTLTQKPIINDFRSDYFPRKVRYKKEALALQKEVRTKGGQAEISKTK